MINRITPLLLFIGFVWGQADLDKLVLKDGTTYFGEYSKIEEEIVYFKPQNAFGFQPISIKQVERLELKDGRVAVLDSKVKSLTLEEYQKLSTKEKALFDAKLINLWHWTFYCPLSGITLYPFIGKIQKMPSEGSIAASLMIGLTIPYLILNLKKVKFSYPESITHEYDRANYKKVYYKNIRERQGKIIMASIAITGGVAFLLFSKAMSDFDLFGDDWGGFPGSP